MTLVAPFGFYGAGNIGDEGTLQGFAHLLAKYPRKVHVWFASRNPAHTSQVEPSFQYYSARRRDLRRWWARYRASAAVVVGGTPIMDLLGSWPLKELTPLIAAARTLRQPIVFIGAGTEHLLREDSRRMVAETIAPSVRHWTVRSARDRDRLISYRVPPDRVTVAADLAWTLPPASPDFGKQVLTGLGLDPGERYLGVNLTNEKFVQQQAPGLVQVVAKFLDELAERRGTRILFMASEVRPNSEFDSAAATAVLNAMRHGDRALLVPNRYWSPPQLQSLIACCRLTISMRYHFCLFSALQGVPFLALTRSDKVADLCWDMNWPHALSLPGLTSAALLDMYQGLEQNTDLIPARLRHQAEVMRERTLRNDTALDAALGHSVWN